MRISRKAIWVVTIGCLVVALLAWWYWSGGWADPPVFVQLSDRTKDPIPPVINQPWGEQFADKIISLHGLPLEKVRAELGEPNSANEYCMRDAHGEFRIELFNFYPNSPRVRIREWIWHYRGFYVAVWSHRIDDRWVVLDSCRWKEGIAF